MPSVASGQVQIPKITTAPPSDTVAKDGAAPATAAAVSLVNQAPVRLAGSFEVRVEIWPSCRRLKRRSVSRCKAA